MGFEWFGLSVWLCVVCGVCCAECWLGEGRGEGWFGVVEKPISKTFSSKRSHIHHHAQSPSPALCTPAFSTTRKPRLPLAFPPQTCAVACCPSRMEKRLRAQSRHKVSRDTWRCTARDFCKARSQTSGRLRVHSTSARCVLVSSLQL